MAVQRVTGSLFTRDPDAECGIGEALFHNADEFNDVLRHKRLAGRKAEASYGWKEAWTRRRDRENLAGLNIELNKFNIII